MTYAYTTKVIIIPNPTLALYFNTFPVGAAKNLVKYFKEEGNIDATVTPQWVRGPMSGTQCCIEMQLVIPPSMLSVSDEPSPYWKLVWELGKPG